MAREEYKYITVGSRTRGSKSSMTACWSKNTTLHVFQPSKTAMVSRCWLLACQMFRLSGSSNYTLSRTSDGMTITNDPSNIRVKTLSKAWDGWCGSQPLLGIRFMPLSIALTASCHHSICIPKCTLLTGGDRYSKGEIPEDNNRLIDVKSTCRVGDTHVPLIVMSEGTDLSNFADD